MDTDEHRYSFLYQCGSVFLRGLKAVKQDILKIKDLTICIRILLITNQGFPPNTRSSKEGKRSLNFSSAHISSNPESGIARLFVIAWGGSALIPTIAGAR